MKCFAVIFNFASGAFGGEQGEDGCDGGGIAKFLENAFDAGESDRREEVFEIEVDNSGTRNVRSGIGHRPATGNETVGCLVGWNLFQNVHQDPLLCRSEITMRSSEFAHPTAFLGHLKADIVGYGGDFGMECEPAQAGNRNVESFREVSRSREKRKLKLLQFFDVRTTI